METIKAYQNLAFTTAQTTKLLTRRSSKKVNVAGINLELDEYKEEIDNIETKYKTRQQALVDKQKTNKSVLLLFRYFS
jgi:hypothetical protein